jgi:hypothetical protein
MCPENFLYVRENYDIFGMSQNQVKTLSWINSGKSNIPPPPKANSSQRPWLVYPQTKIDLIIRHVCKNTINLTIE